MERGTDSEYREWVSRQSKKRIDPSSDKQEERLEWLRPTTLPGIEWLVAENSARRWHAFHENYVICPVLNGDADYRYRGKTQSLVVTSGYMLMEPGETHANTRVRRPADFKVLFISPAVIAQAAIEYGCPQTPHFCVPQGENPYYFRSLWEFHAAIERGETVLEQQSRLVACLRYLFDHYFECGAPASHTANACRALERARDCLHEHFNEAVSLDELSALAGLSRFHLLRAFKNRFGLPPHAYQVDVRVSRARLLLHNGISIADAAAMVGFADQSHFTRHFRRIMGVTPGRYAVMCRSHARTSS
jgi:AraC-like DNA-binding protein